MRSSLDSQTYVKSYSNGSRIQFKAGYRWSLAQTPAAHDPIAAATADWLTYEVQDSALALTASLASGAVAALLNMW
jgi:hypothetical protein